MIKCIEKYKLILLLLVWIFSPAVFVLAQPEGFFPVSDPGSVTQKINESSGSLNTIRASFIQEKNISFLEEKIISKGIMLYEKPDKIRLEYKDPFTYILIMNGSRMMTDNGEKQAQFDLKSNKMFSEINNLIVSSVQGNILGNPNFESRLFENPENYFVRLIPKDKEMSKYIRSIGLLISKKDYTVLELNITEQSDDDTRIQFINKTINENIPTGSFAL